MHHPFFWFAVLGSLLILAIVLFVVWTIWRMTIAHERIERHLSSIERHLAAQLKDKQQGS